MNDDNAIFAFKNNMARTASYGFKSKEEVRAYRLGMTDGMNVYHDAIGAKNDDSYNFEGWRRAILTEEPAEEFLARVEAEDPGTAQACLDFHAKLATTTSGDA